MICVLPAADDSHGGLEQAVDLPTIIETIRDCGWQPAQSAAVLNLLADISM